LIWISPSIPTHKRQAIMANQDTKGKAPPPARLTEENMERAKEMLHLINALPESAEKQALLETKQVAEWKYHTSTCLVKKYSHKVTEAEKVAGVTKDAKGNLIKLHAKGIWCHHCKCSAQDWKRHRKSKKCVKNRAATMPHLNGIVREAFSFARHRDRHKRIVKNGETGEKMLAMPSSCDDRSSPIGAYRRLGGWSVGDSEVESDSESESESDSDSDSESESDSDSESESESDSDEE